MARGRNRFCCCCAAGAWDEEEVQRLKELVQVAKDMRQAEGQRTIKVQDRMLEPRAYERLVSEGGKDEGVARRRGLQGVGWVGVRCSVLLRGRKEH